MQTMKHNLKQSEISNQGIQNNIVNGTGTTNGEGVAPNMHGARNPTSAGCHQATDQTKKSMKSEKAVNKIVIKCWIGSVATK